MTASIFRLSGIVIVCGFIIFTAGCAGSIQSAKQAVDTDVEALDPFSYGDEFAIERNTVIPKDFRNNMLDQRLQGMDTDTDTPSRTERTGDTIPLSDDISEDTGYIYRVQIGIFEDRPSAQKIKEYAEKRIDLTVDVTYDEPFYRVRVGKFETEPEARNCVAFLKGKGFSDSRWIITMTNGH